MTIGNNSHNNFDEEGGGGESTDKPHEFLNESMIKRPEQYIFKRKQPKKEASGWKICLAIVTMMVIIGAFLMQRYYYYFLSYHGQVEYHM